MLILPSYFLLYTTSKDAVVLTRCASSKDQPLPLFWPLSPLRRSFTPGSPLKPFPTSTLMSRNHLILFSRVVSALPSLIPSSLHILITTAFLQCRVFVCSRRITSLHVRRRLYLPTSEGKPPALDLPSRQLAKTAGTMDLQQTSQVHQQLLGVLQPQGCGMRYVCCRPPGSAGRDRCRKYRFRTALSGRKVIETDIGNLFGWEQDMDREVTEQTHCRPTFKCYELKDADDKCFSKN